MTNIKKGISLFFKMKAKYNVDHVEPVAKTPSISLKDRQRAMKATVRRGRKPVTVSWPEQEFTAGELSTAMEGKLSRVSIHTKINSALKNGELVLVRVTKNKMGRPHSVYKKVS